MNQIIVEKLPSGNYKVTTPDFPEGVQFETAFYTIKMVRESLNYLKLPETKPEDTNHV